jgi:Spy/CpxP family protein refolding chaperone
MKSFVSAAVIALLLYAVSVAAQTPEAPGAPGPPPEHGEFAPPPPPPPPHGRHSERGGRGPHGGRPALQRGAERAMEWLREEHPEKFKKLAQLRRENPREFREQVGDCMREYFKQQHPEMVEHFKTQRKQEQQLRKLAEKHRQTEDQEQRAAVETQMRALLEQSFDDRQQARGAELKKLEERLEEFRATLKAREDNKAEMIDLRLKGLIEGETTVEW